MVIHVLAEQTPVSHFAIESQEYLLKNVDFELATDRSIRLYVLPSIFFFFSFKLPGLENASNLVPLRHVMWGLKLYSF